MTSWPLPEFAGESDEERRFREAINRKAGEMQGVVDAAIALRTAPGEVSRARHRARADLEDFAIKAQHAFRLSLVQKVDSPHSA
ncbi:MULTISPECIES: hypothetical protein [Mameliella]|uniref:Uncharacterized protein n=1 Tax=Mameliella alba TaxID=561184 RepID=A0A0B3S349_9RHOB|nr:MULTISPECIES: hypothetical protein [Mameliella]KHQ51106.1 hypothetical protein OA50_04477 [Mameliella alba]